MFPNDDTGQVLAEMHEAGIDLTQVHQVVYFQLFENKDDALAMEKHLKEKVPDMQIDVKPDETPNVWDLEVTVAMIPDYDAIVAQEAEFEQVARKFKGYNDGWGIEA